MRHAACTRRDAVKRNLQHTMIFPSRQTGKAGHYAMIFCPHKRFAASACTRRDGVSSVCRAVLWAALTLAGFVGAPGLVGAHAHAGAVQDEARLRAGGFSTDFTLRSVELSEIIPGGPPKDGIPSIDTPQFVPAGAVSTAPRGDGGFYLTDRDPVIELALNGLARAYPLRILIWHEIVNDELAGRPVVVTYCPLCNSAIVFERRMDGQTLDFGTTGLLRNSDLVMYDRTSESFWQQFTGKAIVGAHTGAQLRRLPSLTRSFASFKMAHPRGEVLVPSGPARPYGRNPYVSYDSRELPYPLFTGDLPEDLPPMARVLIVYDGAEKHAVTLARLRAEGEVALAGDVVATWRSGMASALDTPAIENGADIGEVHVQRRGQGGDGLATPLAHDVTFAFVIHAFEPGLPVMR